MEAALLEAPQPSGSLASKLRLLALARCAAGTGATLGEMARDLAPYVTHKLAPAAWRNGLTQTVAALAAQGLLVRHPRNRLELTERGRTAIREELGGKVLPRGWEDIRDICLIALALDLIERPESARKALAKPDGLRAAILQRAYGLQIKGPPTAAKLRSALALAALERAFGNSIKAGLGGRTGFSGKAGRLLAAQLSARPRDFGTDQRLIAALAAEKIGSFQTDADSLRVAILRTFVSLPGASPAPQRQPSSPPAAETRPVPRPADLSPPRPAAAARPDLQGFARAVLAAATAGAEGWPGNRKAFISQVWRTIESRHPEWGLSIVEFKAMLAEAHRTGHITLANADLKDKRNMRELQESAIAYKNTVWHFVRAED